MKNLKYMLSFLALSVSINAYSLDVLLDEKAVDIPLPVGKEIVVTFPKAVVKTEELNGNTSKLAQFLRPDGVLMLKAGEAFGESRMIASMIDGNVVVLDLNATIGAVNHETIKLVDPKTLKNNNVKRKDVAKTNPYKPDFLKSGAAMTKNAVKQSRYTNKGVGFNELVQYGFRHFVGPSRLIGNMKAKRVPIGRISSKRLIRVWSKRLSIKPLRQWKVENRYITVLLVNNKSAFPVQFDPRALRGRIMFAAALYPVIQPQGSVNDQTLWAIVTSIPFNKAIR